MTATSALRGRPSSRTAEPSIAWSARDGELDEVELARAAPTSSGGSATGGAGETRPSRRATHSSVVPWRSAETMTTKKTALKIVSLCAHVRREREGREHDRHGAAQARPAEEQRARGCVKRLNAVEAQTAAGRATRIRSEREREARSSATSGSWLREDEQAEHDEEHDLGDEREALVEGDELAPVARRRAADREADEVDGEEAAAADHVGGAERERRRGDRRDGRERADRLRDARERPTSPPRRARRRRASPSPSWRTTRSDEVAEAVGVRAARSRRSARA